MEFGDVIPRIERGIRPKGEAFALGSEVEFEREWIGPRKVRAEVARRIGTDAAVVRVPERPGDLSITSSIS
jgi:hypothetical protein